MLFDIATPEEKLLLIAHHYDSMQKDIDDIIDAITSFSDDDKKTSRELKALAKTVNDWIDALGKKHETFTALQTKNLEKESRERTDGHALILKKIESIEKLKNAISGDSVKSVKALKDWMEKRLKSISNDFDSLRNLKPSSWGGSSRMIYNNSPGTIGVPMSPQNLYSDWNLIMGPGLSLTAVNNTTAGWVDVTISVTGGSGGSTLGFETPTGTIDGVNATFTVVHTPLFVVLNGATYFENDGYTLAGLTITMLVIPQTGSTLRSAFNI